MQVYVVLGIETRASPVLSQLRHTPSPLPETLREQDKHGWLCVQVTPPCVNESVRELEVEQTTFWGAPFSPERH